MCATSRKIFFHFLPNQFNGQEDGARDKFPEHVVVVFPQRTPQAQKTSFRQHRHRDLLNYAAARGCLPLTRLPSDETPNAAECRDLVTGPIVVAIAESDTSVDTSVDTCKDIYMDESETTIWKAILFQNYHRKRFPGNQQKRFIISYHNNSTLCLNLKKMNFQQIHHTFFGNEIQITTPHYQAHACLRVKRIKKTNDKHF